jgi:hypothetical protein
VLLALELLQVLGDSALSSSHQCGHSGQVLVLQVLQ